MNTVNFRKLTSGQIWPIKDVHIQSLKICEYVTLHDKRNFVDVIKVRILTQRDYFRLSKWAQRNHKDPFKKDYGGSKRQKDM